jgi:hypothetical protein
MLTVFVEWNGTDKDVGGGGGWIRPRVGKRVPRDPNCIEGFRA